MGRPYHLSCNWGASAEFAWLMGSSQQALHFRSCIALPLEPVMGPTSIYLHPERSLGEPGHTHSPVASQLLLRLSGTLKLLRV